MFGSQLDALEPGLTLRLMYAGHVLGAVMVEVRRGSDAVLYTGSVVGGAMGWLDAA